MLRNIKHTSCNIDVATLLDLISNNMLIMLLEFNSCSIDNATPGNVHIMSNNYNMSCYLKFSDIDDSALLNYDFISNKISLSTKSFSIKRVLKTAILLARNEKRLAFLQIPTNVKPWNFDFYQKMLRNACFIVLSSCHLWVAIGTDTLLI